MPSIGSFLHTQLNLKIPKPTVLFASKTVIITGTSSGLGQEATKHIVRLDANNNAYTYRLRSTRVFLSFSTPQL